MEAKSELHYGFFGLTALGPTSCFKQGQLSAVGVAEFTLEEWTAVFRRCSNRDTGMLSTNDLTTLLRDIYHGPPPEFVQVMLTERLASPVSEQEFVAIIAQLQEDEKSGNLAQQQAEGSMYNSASEYQERIRSHKLLDGLPKEKFNAPMTTNQSVGWSKVDYNQVLADIVPKLSCPETQYADAMVKAGVYY